jgi:hypothetical protein
VKSKTTIAAVHLCGEPPKMTFSLLLVGVAVVIVIIMVACVLFFVSRSVRD